MQNRMKPDNAQLLGFPDSKQSRQRRQGFTLIELLVVIAITAVLFFLLVRPLIESLRLTQRAQLQAAAQDSARKTLEIVSRELASAVYVFDNASHPFALPSGTATTVNDTLFSNFLDLDVPNDPSSPTNPGTTVVAHAFNAKLDFVPARRSASGGLIDPTTGDPISATQSGNGSATLNTTGLQFPLAPGTTIIRYFVGLKDPTISYRNTAEKLGLNTTGNPNNVDNTYILYRVQFPLYKKDATTGNYSVNDTLLRVNPTGKPELDDPDFFRYVSATDIDWLSPTHVAYGGAGAESVTMHNRRVDNWMKIAKPVITAPNIDLLVLPRYADGTPIYDANHVPSSGSTTDPVRAGAATPTVKTSINFTPATITADAAPSSSSDYGSLGVPMNAADNEGLPYVPTVYTASSQSWGFPPHITLAPQGALSATTPYYTTDANPTSLAPTNATISTADPGDLMEYYHTGTSDTAGKPVYDITKGCVIATAGAANHNYVPLAVNPDTGTLSFDTPALPAPNNQASTQSSGYDFYNRYWTASAADINTGNLVSCPSALTATPYGFNTPGVLDLTNLSCDTNGSLAQFGSTGNNTSPLPKLGSTPTDLQCANAFIVPGSVRVYGPDQTPGPNQGNSILYTQASPTVPLTYNQYRVDSLNSLLTFNVDGGNQLPILKADNQTPADRVKITFNYQANLVPVDMTQSQF